MGEIEGSVMDICQNCHYGRKEEKLKLRCFLHPPIRVQYSVLPEKVDWDKWQRPQVDFDDTCSHFYVPTRVVTKNSELPARESVRVKKIFYLASEAAEQLGITRKELASLVSDGKLRQFRDAGMEHFKVEDVDALKVRLDLNERF